MSNYDYRDSMTDVQSIIHCINLLGTDLVGLELGTHRCYSFLTILQNCPNIKTLYGVDSYQPYVDYLKTPYDGTPAYEVSEADANENKQIALDMIKNSGHSDKAKLLIMDSNEALDHVEYGELDFIFIDTYMTYEQAKSDLINWYPKVRRGGLFAGHDVGHEHVLRAVIETRQEYLVGNPLSIFDNTFAWIKDE